MKIKQVVNTEMSDELLLEAYTEHRDAQAFSIIYNRHFDNLSNYLKWLMKSPEKAKDITQSTFIKIYLKPENFDTQRNFKVWLFSIGKNLLKNALREDQVRQNHLQQFSQIPTDENTVRKDKSKKLKKLEHAVQNLSEKHREVFILKYTNNLSINEIAQICECCKGTVKSRIFYALQEIKKTISHEEL